MSCISYLNNHVETHGREIELALVTYEQLMVIEGHKFLSIPCPQRVPVKVERHWQKKLDPVVMQAPPFRHGDGLQGLFTELHKKNIPSKSSIIFCQMHHFQVQLTKEISVLYF